ncbi:hypothetical protein Nepgr_030981 [Nepenthes gracilis]|uniref:Uncharacterized protein n=1 Tax=Nepenthes gracilis TaxID=150966 RepID=A0AAD3THL4_NEPGR|nr:hypothetical protein Nepgr_030981 [Nepenthes gracilis]
MPRRDHFYALLGHLRFRRQQVQSRKPAGMSHVRCPLMPVSSAVDGRPSEKPPSPQRSSKAAKHVIALRISHHNRPCCGGSNC